MIPLVGDKLKIPILRKDILKTFQVRGMERVKLGLASFTMHNGKQKQAIYMVWAHLVAVRAERDKKYT